MMLQQLPFMEGIVPELIFNCTQIGVRIVPSSSRVLEEKEDDM